MSLLGSKVVFLAYFIATLLALTVSPGAAKNASRDDKIIRTSRRFPFCVTGKQLQDYKANLKEGPKLDKFLAHSATHRDRKSNKGNCLNCGTNKNRPGLVESIQYFRINSETATPTMPLLRQWFHILIQTQKPCEGLIVQSIGSPFALPYGQFDLEYGCSDCNDTEIDLKAADTEEALALKGQAAVIPCVKRTYLHARHPNVYAYASNVKRQSFHLNFNFVDIPCRFASMFQFMILAVENLNGSTTSPNADYFHSGVVDHDFVDSLDGMPYPTHHIMMEDLKCHVPDKNLALEEHKLNFRLAINGNRSELYYSPDFDDCILQDSNADWIDVKYKLSNSVCKLPGRKKCDFESPLNLPPERTKPSDDEPIGLCLLCDDLFNKHNEMTLRLIRIGYVGNRLHGFCMIIGCVALVTLSIHIARYFKEYAGSCVHVGWWSWAHLLLSCLSVCSIWMGIAAEVAAPPRANNRNETPVLGQKREALIKDHKLIGYAAVLLFHVVLLCGLSRPANGSVWWILMYSHSFGGYATVILSCFAVIISTCCNDVSVLAVLLMTLPFLPWLISLVFQVLSDIAEPMHPRRHYFPVVEAVQVHLKMASLIKIPTFVILGLVFVMNMTLVGLLLFHGNYIGLFTQSPCVNCIWKYDEWVPRRVNKSLTSVYMWEYYKCKYSTHLWETNALKRRIKN